MTAHAADREPRDRHGNGGRGVAGASGEGGGGGGGAGLGWGGRGLLPAFLKKYNLLVILLSFYLVHFGLTCAVT